MKTPVENFLNSIYAVTIPMLLLILAFSIKLSALFYTVFEIPVLELKLAASILLAVAVSLTLLSVSVNAKLFETDVFPIVFAICSGVMLLFVFKVISVDVLHWSEYVKRGFLSAFLATVEYVYSKLFVKKYQEHKFNESHPLADERLNKARESLKKSVLDLNQTKQDLERYKAELKCPKCQKQHDTFSRRKNCNHKILELTAH
ncbi:hypothetical protein [Aquimarina algiphila]|uniref:hypothetical protein n=1 Tax=Aquimarina algiphila TaxID=2047982 RepID=UPI00232F5143|nr:hypothetical protein [Aquimarina algiphila]